MVADTDSHTLRLVEFFGKGPLVPASLPAGWRGEVLGQRTAEKKRLEMLAKVTPVASYDEPCAYLRPPSRP